MNSFIWNGSLSLVFFHGNSSSLIKEVSFFRSLFFTLINLVMSSRYLLISSIRLLVLVPLFSVFLYINSVWFLQLFYSMIIFKFWYCDNLVLLFTSVHQFTHCLFYVYIATQSFLLIYHPSLLSYIHWYLMFIDVS